MRPTRRGVAAVLAAAFLVVAGLALSPGTALAHLQGALYSPWFPAALVGLYLLRPVLAWPISALSLLVGYRYGLAVGFPVAMVGVVATSLVPYAAARRLRADTGWIGRARDGSERFFATTGDLRGVVAARLAPTPAEPVSMAAGVAGVPTAAFVLGTVLGELPWTAAAVFAGHSMHRLSISAAAGPWLAVAGALAAALLLAGPAYRHLRGRATAE